MIQQKELAFLGVFGLKRAILSEDDKTTRYSNVESGISKDATNAISDHVFGRAFDIRSVGKYSNLGASKETYAQALDDFLAKLSLLPAPLIPDLITIHPDVAREKGIGEGFESINTPIKTQYPQLKHVNFEFGTEHTDNIHISFGPQRAGVYMGQTGWKTTPLTSKDDFSDITDNSGAIDKVKDKAYSNYKSSGVAFNLYEIFVLLTKEAYFSDEAAAVFCAIAARESGTNPSSFNGQCFENSSSFSGDFSIGMLQFNLLSLINKQSNTARDVFIYYNGSSVVQQAVPVHKLMYVKPEASSWDPNAVARKVIQIYSDAEKAKEPNSAGKAKITTDDRLWYPVNQAWFLRSKWGDGFAKNTKIIDSSSGFYHWGDYDVVNNGVKSPRSDCGFIFKTKFQDAVSVYLTTGKPIKTLEDWVRNKFKENPRTNPYLEQWMDGTVFYSKPKDGSLIDENSSKPIVYTPSPDSIIPGADGGGEVPSFQRADIEACANWFTSNRVTQWLSAYRSDLDGNLGCDRFARILSAALGLFGRAEIDLINQPWSAVGTKNVDATVPTATLRQYETAAVHFNDLKANGKIISANQSDGSNPPSGWLVFWSGGDDGYGHVGVSIGGGLYVDQHTEAEGSNKVRPRSISSTTFPGSKYTYEGSSSVWQP